jgi:hypothetical protein
VLTDARRSKGSPLSDTVDTLILELLEWMGESPRPYAEVIEAWGTSCPRLPVWEETSDRGFIAHRHVPGRGAFVSVTAAGAEHLRKHRRADGRHTDQRRQSERARGRERAPRIGTTVSWR